MTEYELFRRVRAPAVRTPAVTLMQRGLLSLNSAAFEALGSPKAVELMYSRKDKRIGVRAADPSAAHSYKPHTAAKDKGRGPYLVSGSAFLTYFNIQVEHTTRYTATMDGNILSISLKDGGTPLISNRTGRAKPNDAAGSG